MSDKYCLKNLWVCFPCALFISLEIGKLVHHVGTTVLTRIMKSIPSESLSLFLLSHLHKIADCTPTSQPCPK